MTDGVAHGLLLAAGRGSRMGRPKALVTTDGTAWVARSADVLRDGGCRHVTVVLGADAQQARPLVPDHAGVVVAEHWAAGQSASLAAGLEALEPTDATAALVHLVDLPDVTQGVVRRVLSGGVTPTSLRRATFDGRPGHPVLIGRSHWHDLRAVLAGDDGARGYLAAAGTTVVECGDLATGEDLDTLPGQAPLR